MIPKSCFCFSVLLFFGFSVLLFFSSLVLSVPSFGDTAWLQVLLDQASQDVILAKFDLNAAKEAFNNGDALHAKDMLNEAQKHYAVLSERLDALSAEKEVLILDLKLTEQYEKIADAYQLLNQETMDLEEKIEAALAGGKKNIDVLTDANFVMNNRPEGSISSDRNLEGGVQINYLFNDNSKIEFRGRGSALQLLDSQTQNFDVGLNYLTSIGGGEFTAGLNTRPFVDNSDTINNNTDTSLTLNYNRQIDNSSNVAFRGSYQIQDWANHNDQDYNVAQAGANYCNNLNVTQSINADVDLSSQRAPIGSNQSSTFSLGVGYDEKLAKDQKWGSKLSFDNRTYSDNAASAYYKTGLSVNYTIGKLRYDVNLINNNAPASTTNNYWHYGISQNYSQSLSEAINLMFRAGFLARNFQNQPSNYSKIDLQANLNYVFAKNQCLRLTDNAERTFYLTDTSSYLHNLFGVKYELQLYPGSAVSIGERFTIDNYPSNWSQNATRHQVDVLYTLPILQDLGGSLTGGYELKNYFSPSSSRSDYNAYNLSVALEYSFLVFGRANLAFNYYQKRNAQNSSADTITQNVTCTLGYQF